MRRITRGLDGDPAEIQPARQVALRRQIIQRGYHDAAEIGVDVGHER